MLVVSVVALAGCGSGDGPAGDGATTGAATPTATATSTPTATPTATGGRGKGKGRRRVVRYEGQTGSKAKVSFRVTARRDRVQRFRAKGLLPCKIRSAKVDDKGDFEATCSPRKGDEWVVTGRLLEGKLPRGKVVHRFGGKEAGFGWTAKPVGA